MCVRLCVCVLVPVSVIDGVHCVLYVVWRPVVAAQEEDEQMKLTALELLARSKPRDGVAHADVTEVSYHFDRLGSPYCRVKLRVQQWLAGVHPDAVVKQVQHAHQAVSGGKPATVLRVPSLCLVRGSCYECGAGGEVLQVR